MTFTFWSSFFPIPSHELHEIPQNVPPILLPSAILHSRLDSIYITVSPPISSGSKAGVLRKAAKLVSSSFFVPSLMQWPGAFTEMLCRERTWKLEIGQGIAVLLLQQNCTDPVRCSSRKSGMDDVETFSWGIGISLRVFFFTGSCILQRESFATTTILHNIRSFWTSRS